MAHSKVKPEAKLDGKQRIELETIVCDGTAAVWRFDRLGSC